MFGFIIGTLCLIALFATLRGHHRRHDYGYGLHGHWRHDEPPWRESWRESWRQRAPGPRGYLRGLFVRLDTTPGQEKAIVAILEAARDRARGMKSELKETRKQIAALLGSDVLDRAALEARLEQPRAAFERLGTELVQTLAAIHELLDDRQRRLLGELLADGSLGHRPYPHC